MVKDLVFGNDLDMYVAGDAWRLSYCRYAYIASILIPSQSHPSEYKVVLSRDCLSHV